METLQKANQQYLYTLKDLTYQVHMLILLNLPSRAEHDVKQKEKADCANKILSQINLELEH